MEPMALSASIVVAAIANVSFACAVGGCLAALSLDNAPPRVRHRLQHACTMAALPRSGPLLWPIELMDMDSLTTHSNLLTLPPGVHAGIQIRPRWPARHVHVDERVLGKLQAIQAELPAELDLILTRGYEPPTSGLGHARRRFRALGIGMFRVLYPDRRNELADIFGSNGHDIDGTHIDVSFSLNGRRVRMLPLGVFTPPFWQQRRVRQCASALAQIQAALMRHGFQIHRNATESLQIHCDLVR